MELFALDLGNGWIKGKNRELVFTIPSQIAIDNRVETTYLGDMSNIFDVDSFESRLDEKTKYLYGKDITKIVKKKSELITLHQEKERIKNKHYKMAIEFSLAKLAASFKGDSLDVFLVTGMPSADIGTNEEKELRDFLHRTHIVKMNGKEKTIHVKYVTILPQPFGTLMNLYLDPKTGLLDERARGRNVIVDFGAGTTIVDTYYSLERDLDKSATINEGQNKLYRDASIRLKDIHNLKDLHISHVEDAFKTNVLNLSSTNKFEVAEIVSYTTNKFAAKKATEIKNIIGDTTEIDRFILTGGGVATMEEIFKKEIGINEFESVKKSQLSNVTGYYKFGAEQIKRMKKE